jgi:cytoskeleton protein RodZ
MRRGRSGFHPLYDEESGEVSYMTLIGETLRRERLKRNLDLDRVSNELKISRRLLEAIEDDRFDKLPGGVFARSFVRQYAHLLGMDEDEISGELQRILEPASASTQSAALSRTPEEIPMPRMEPWEPSRRFQWSSSLPALAMVVVMMLACSAVYSWWQRSRHSTVRQEQPVASTRSAAPSAVPAEVQPAPASAPDPGAASGPVSPAAAAQPSGASVAASVAGSGGDNPQAPVRVQLTAQEPVWVSVRSDGKNVFSAILQANESRVFDGNETVMLRIGNAGGIEVSLNGKPIGSLGPKGQIRTVQLTPGGFQIVLPEAPRPSAPPPPPDNLDPL